MLLKKCVTSGAEHTQLTGFDPWRQCWYSMLLLNSMCAIDPRVDLLFYPATHRFLLVGDPSNKAMPVIDGGKIE